MRLYGIISGVLILSLLLVTAAATAQDAPRTAILTGRVIDPAGVPIPGAQVSLAGTAFASSSAADGSFRFEKLPPGRFVVDVVTAGFYPAQPRTVELLAGSETDLVVELQPEAIVEETIVVTGTGTEYAVREAPVRTELITTEIVDTQVKTTLAEAFQATIPGVRVEMNCQNCGFMQLRMNGLEGPYTQILEDGLPSYSGVAAVYGLEQIPAGFLDQIEVVKGGNSALYGPNAVAGVVNLIRREPTQNRFRVDLMSGWQFGRPEQQAGASGQMAELPGGFAGDFYYRGINRVPVDRDRDGFSDLGKRRLHSGGFGLYRRFLGDAAQLSFSGTMADEFRRGGSQFDLPPHETWIAEQIDSRRSTGSLRWNHSISPTTFYSAKASLAYLFRDTYYGAEMDPGAYGSTRNPLWVSDVQLGHQAGRHSLLFGYQYWREFVDDRAPAYGRKLGGLFTNNGLYVQDEWRVNSRLMLIGGVRADKSNQLADWIASPRAGIKVGITSALSWRASFSTGFRAPAVFDEDLHITQVGGEGFLVQNGPDLKQERSVSFNSGLDYLGIARGRRYKLGVNFFWTDLDGNHTLIEDDAPGQEFRRLLRVNGPGAYVRGVDLDASYQLTSQLSLRGGATIQTSRFDEPEEQFGATHFFRSPDRYGFAGFDWDLPGDVEVSGTGDFTGPMLVPHYAGFIPEDRLDKSKSFAVFNVVASKYFSVAGESNLRLYFLLNNMSDAFQPDLDQGPSRDAGYVYGPGEMRRAVIGLSYEF